MSSIIEAIDVIIARIEGILTIDGYTVDLVDKVMVDEESIDVDFLPVAMLFTGDLEEVSRGGHHILWKRVMALDVLVKADPTDQQSWRITERLLDDVHRALMGPELNKACTNTELRLRDTVKDFRIKGGSFSIREDGHRIMGVSFDLEIEHITQYANHTSGG